MKRRFVPPGERGAALLAVLLLVAVTGAIAAAAIEKLRLSRAVATNIVALDQARALCERRRAARHAHHRRPDRRGSPDRRPSRAAGTARSGGSRCPAAASRAARVRDGGNCFNLNSVVEGDPRTRLTRRNSGVAEFAGLMQVLEVPEAEARRIAEAAADWADSDAEPGPGGAEDSAYAAGERALSDRQHLVRRSRRARRRSPE